MSSQPSSRGGSASTDRSHDLVDARLLAAPSPGEASRDRYEQVVYANLSDAAGTHWFVCELDHDAGRAGVWEWPVGDERSPGWREVSLQDLASRTGSNLVTRDQGWQPRTTSGSGVDAYSVEMDRIDQVSAKLAHAAGSGTPAEIDPEFASRVARAQAIATSPGMSVWDRRGGLMTEARRAEAHGLHTYDRLISQQVTRQAPEPVPVPQTVVRQTTR